MIKEIAHCVSQLNRLSIYAVHYARDQGARKQTLVRFADAILAA